MQTRVRNSVAPYRGQNPQNREKRVSESKNPISRHPRKGCSELKNPHFPGSALCRNGDFLTQGALFWGGRKWGLFDSETLFSRFWGILTPVRGKRIPKTRDPSQSPAHISNVELTSSEVLCLGSVLGTVWGRVLDIRNVPTSFLCNFVRPEKWGDSTVLLPGAFWAHGASKMAILGTSLLLYILQCFGASEGMLPPGACRSSRASRAEAFTLPPCAPKSHMRPLPHLGASDNST